MTLTITSIYAAILALLLIALSAAVIMRRGKTGISLNHGDDLPLAAAIRRHGNFTEYVPLALLLLAMMELRGAPSLWLHGIGGVLTLGRFIHVLGINPLKANEPARVFGASLTLLSLGAAALYLLATHFI